MAGRKTKLTPTVQRDICEALKSGCYLEDAAAYSGVSGSAVYKWKARGIKERDRLEAHPRTKIKPAERRYLQFVEAVEKATARSDIRDLAIIENAAITQWQAAAWRLERRHPAKWGRRQVLEHSGKDGGPIEFKGGVLTAEDLRDLSGEELAVVKKLLKARGG